MYIYVVIIDHVVIYCNGVRYILYNFLLSKVRQTSPRNCSKPSSASRDLLPIQDLVKHLRWSILQK